MDAFSITVQPMSIARRSKKKSDHEVSNKRRPHKQSKSKTQIFLEEGDGEMYHSLPKSSEIV